jgi:hypothetical protein
MGDVKFCDGLSSSLKIVYGDLGRSAKEAEVQS